MDAQISKLSVVLFSEFGIRNNTIEYEPISRMYFLLLHDEDQLDGTYEILKYCPWCGTKLPESLLFKINEILEEEYGLDDPDGEDASKVPPEFHTDEWWKKRGL